MKCAPKVLSPTFGVHFMSVLCVAATFYKDSLKPYKVVYLFDGHFNGGFSIGGDIYACREAVK